MTVQIIYQATQYPDKKVIPLTPFMDATKRLIIKKAKVTAVKVCQNLFLPVVFNIAK